MRRPVHILFILALLAPLAGLLAQPPDTVWTRRFGGTWDESSRVVFGTSGGGIMVAGAVADSFMGLGQYDALLMRVSADGRVQWQKQYGGEQDEFFSDAAESPDGGYVLVGYTDTFVQYQRAAYAVRTDDNGDTLWTRALAEAPRSACAYAVANTEGGSVVVGSREDPYGTHFYVVRLTNAGDTLWTRIYRRTAIYGVQDDALDVASLDDGGCIVVGRRSDRPIFPNLRKYDMYAMRLTSTGDTVWTRAIGGSEDDEEIRAIAAVGSDEWIIAGTVRRDSSQSDHLFVGCLNEDGDVLWTRELDYSGLDTYATSVFGEASGQFVVCGGTQVWSPAGQVELPMLVRFDAGGDTLWARTYDSPQPFGSGKGGKLPDGGYLLTGTTGRSTWPYDLDIWLIKTEPELSVPWTPVSRSHQVFQVYPNPFNSVTTLDFVLPRPSRVSIRVHDVLGRDVGTISDAFYPSGRHTILWQCPSCASGTYWISMTGDGFHLVRKAILLR